MPRPSAATGPHLRDALRGHSRLEATAALAGAVLALALLLLGGAGCSQSQAFVSGTERTLRASTGPSGAGAGRPKLLVLAIDGVGRDLLYEGLSEGRLPEMSALLGGRDEAGRLPHAHLDGTVLSVMPSCTLPAWASVFSGAPPAEHGITGNEFFVRETRTLAAPAPVSFDDREPTMRCYTGDYANRLLAVPSVYDRLREREPSIDIWVSMSQFYSGADRLFIADRSVLLSALVAFLENNTGAGDEGDGDREEYADLDASTIDVLCEALDREPAPDVLTVYLPGADLYAHVAPEGPDQARRDYLSRTLDPAIGRLRAKLAAKGALEDRYVLVVSDHGHTEVLSDDVHAITAREQDSPPAVLRAAGFDVRPFALEDEGEGQRFSAVLAYGGAVAYVYLADRASSTAPGEPFNWTRPPRYREDVLACAEAFRRANEEGAVAPSLMGALDAILVREPRPFGEVDAPFEVYVGGGRTVSVAQWLAARPHPSYVALEERLRELAAGRFGERAGDVMLIAHNGDRERPEERFYYSDRYRSWHGSPSRQDSEVPLIVAHPRRSSAEIARDVRAGLGERPRLWKVADLMLALRASKGRGAAGAR